ncbi:MAG TPA: FG-GAP-like repeat-containing protein [Phycisphaerae bacterium]
MHPPSVRYAAVLVGCLALTSAARAITPFTEEALQRGINYSAAYLPPELVGMAGGSQGVCFADLDNDGDPDLVLVGRSDGVVGVFENDGTGHFVLHNPGGPGGTGMPLLVKASSITAADYDGDGDLDLFLPQIVYPTGFIAPHYLMRNDGGWHFTDVSAAAGILPGGSTTGAAWGDYDGDGLVDLYVVNYSWPNSPINNRLYHNLGNGTLAEVAAALGVDDPGGYGFQASFVDYDLDGDVDLLVANDRVGYVIPPSTTPNPDNRLFRNNGNGTFSDISAASGIGTNPPGTMFSMGIAIGDLDRNGWVDFFISNLASNDLAHNRLHLGSGPAGCGPSYPPGCWFTENALGYGMGALTVSWGVQFFDLDNDGWLDLYVANTPLGGSGSPAPQLYHFTGTPPAMDIAPQIGLDTTGGGYGVTTADIDNDGDMDLVVVRPYDRVLLYINHTQDAAPDAQHWLKVRLRGAGLNHFAVGATVFVQDDSGWQQHAVVAGNSYKSQEDLVVHFGVGATTLLHEVRVLWPDGTAKSIHEVPTNQTLEICKIDSPPAAASAPMPANGSDNVPLDITLNWTPGAPGPGMFYHVYLGTTSPPPLADTTLLTSWSPSTPGLSPGTNYYWRVESLTGGCGSALGPIWSFTTVGSVPTNNLAVNITSPTTRAAFTTAMPTISLAGTVTSTADVSAVTWSNTHPPTADSGAVQLGVPDIGTVAWSAADIPLQAGTNEIAITATDILGATASAQLQVTYTSTPVDALPVIAITAPTSQSTFLTDQELLSIAGTASGNTVSISWANSRSGSGPCQGTTSWSAQGIALLAGDNEITVTAHSAAGQTASAALRVTYRESIPPVVTITQPTSQSRYETTEAQLRLEGAASDNVGVTRVTWQTNAGDSGDAAGTAEWSIDGIALNAPEIEITVTAADAAGNIGTGSLTVVRLDLVGPAPTPGGPNPGDGDSTSGTMDTDPATGMQPADGAADQSNDVEEPPVDTAHRSTHPARRSLCGLGMSSVVMLLLGLGLMCPRRQRI